MLFNVNINAAVPGGPNINVQVEAPDLEQAMAKATPMILKSARDSAAVLLATLPAEKPAPATPAA